MNILLIVASGKSSRFGGFPKAFCQLGAITNIENTIEKSKIVVDRVYIGVNEKVYDAFHDKIENCKMFSIKTGQGDAHSLLKCLKYIKQNETVVEKLLVCWGDAVFVSSKPFEELIASNEKVAVACSLDKNPYAWFDVNEDDVILKAHFAKEEGFILEGLHDQSLFLLDLEYAIKYLDKYRMSLGILEDNDEENANINEMKLLFSFEYLLQIGACAKICRITNNQVLSFNTQEELEGIKKKINI